jgi:polar amino acid transport system permease protein
MTGPARKSSEPDFPWWLVILCLIGVGLAILIALDGLYAQLFATLAKGLGITIYVALVAFTLASLVGLSVALIGMSGNVVLRQIARFYVEVFRGIPVLVLLFYVAFVGAPALVALINFAIAPLIELGIVETFLIRDFSLTWRAIIALTIAYSSFIAEIFRAGIQSVDEGQIDAAKALGLSRYNRFRLIILPQAVRTIFPAWSNDFIAMVKDSSLVSVLGVADITQMAKVYAAGSFRFFETYSILAYIYLILTIGLSIALRKLEAVMRNRAL